MERHIPSLTGIRALAAVWVLLDHTILQLRAAIPLSLDLQNLICSGWMGVDLFFILSGAIMAHTYPAGIPDLTAYRIFLVRRLARIYPVHLAVLVGTVLMYAIAGTCFGFSPLAFEPLEFLRHVILIHGWAGNRPGMWNDPSWSLSAEWFAYIAFPLFTALAGLATTRRTLLLAVATLLLAYMAMTYLFASHPVVDARPFHSGVPRIAFCFALGVLVYRLRPYLRPRPKAIGLFTDFFTIAIPVAAVLLSRLGLTPWFLAALFLPWILGLSFQQGRSADFLSRPFMTFLGCASYSLYMVHIPVQMVFWQAWPPERLAAMPTIIAAACVTLQLAITIAIASATYVLIESPSRRYLVATFGQRALPSPAPHPKPSRLHNDP